MKWNAVSVSTKFASEFGVRIGLALVLAPKDFGVYSFAASLIAIIATTCGMGIQPTLIQRPRDELTSSIHQLSFKLLIATSFAGSLVTFCGATLAGFTQIITPEVAYSTQILAAGLMVIPFSTMYAVTLSRSMQFNFIAKAEVFSNVIFLGIAILLAVSGAEYLSLVIALLISQISKAALLSTSSKFRPTTRGKIRDARQTLVKSKFYLFGALISVIRSKSDVIILGTMLGPSALGVYALAFAITDSAQTQVASIVNKTMFPAYSKMQNDPILREIYYLKISKYIALFLLPAYALLYVLSEPLVNYFLSTEWADSALLIKILCIAGMVYAVGGYPSEIINALGRPDITFKISTFNYLLVSLPTLVCLTEFWGPQGTAYSVLVHYTTLRASHFTVLHIVFGVNLHRIISATLPGLVLAIAIFAIGYTISS